MSRKITFIALLFFVSIVITMGHGSGEECNSECPVVTGEDNEGNEEYCREPCTRPGEHTHHQCPKKGHKAYLIGAPAEPGRRHRKK